VDISVVIATYNRAEGLRNTLAALTFQKYPRFEVIVVNGPSTDHTESVLGEHAGGLKVSRNTERNLALSRNLGLAEASGEIVAFIDDDAIPYAGWLSQLAAAFDQDEVGAAGGVVYDASGFSLQYRFSVCDRMGATRHDISQPLEQYGRPGADPFLYLQGTNMSFRRRCLVEIGGFDEEFHYYYDDVDVSMRIIDQGYKLKVLDRAPVLHKYLPSYARDHQGILQDPFVAVKNRYYFALQQAKTQAQYTRTIASLREYCDQERHLARYYLEAGQIDKVAHDYCLERIDEGAATGMTRAGGERRLRREFKPPEPATFVPFAPARPKGGRLSICFLSREFPPNEFGGVGRYTKDLAQEAARQGHEVHVITHTSEENEVDFKDSVWLHRLADLNPWPVELDSIPLRHNLMHLWGAYHEVCRIHELSALDVVVAPLWLCEGALCAMDPRFATVLTLMTAMRKISELHPSWKENQQVQQLVALETATFAAARYIHAISQDVMDRCIECYGPTKAKTFVLPLGSRENPARALREKGGQETLTVLFVGRLERRKGVDLLLDAAARLLAANENLEFILVGKDTENTELGETYSAAFKRKYADRPEIVSRVTFVGWVEDSELQKFYADADVCCFPSRYESFGLVLVEAMAAGKPVVATRIGGIPTIIEDGGNGLLVEPGDAADLAIALEKLLSDANMRSNMGHRSRELFERRFSIAPVTERILEAYQEAARAHATSAESTSRDGMVGAFSALILKATKIKLRTAQQIAKALLSQERKAIELNGALHSIWPTSDDEFVSGLYQHIFRRPPDSMGRQTHIESLRSGQSRLALLDLFLNTDEARQKGVDSRWVDRGMLPGQAKESHRFIKAPARITWLRHYLRYTLEMPIRLHDDLAALPKRLESLRVANDSSISKIADELRTTSGSFAESHSRQIQLEAETQRIKRELTEHIEQSAVKLDSLLRRVDNQHTISETISGALESINRHQAVLANWVHLLQTKMEMIALDVRELQPSASLDDSYPAPQIADQGRFDEMSLEGTLRLNLGCGENPLADYINVDRRTMPGVNIIADVRNLGIAAGTVQEIASSHLIEHFRSHHFAKVVLPYWKSLLRPDGLLRIVCPNWEAMLAQLAEGRMSLADFHTVTFGGQDYDGDDHFAMYTPANLSKILADAGFLDIRLIAEARQNGLCPEMELTAIVQ
jgi:glycogen(starch) synthase